MILGLIQIYTRCIHVPKGGKKLRVVFQTTLSRDSSASQKFVDLWNGEVVVPSVQIFRWQALFQERCY